MDKDYNMFSIKELDEEKTQLEKEFNELKEQCESLSEKMLQLSTEYGKIDQIIKKRQGKA